MLEIVLFLTLAWWGLMIAVRALDVVQRKHPYVRTDPAAKRMAATYVFVQRGFQVAHVVAIAMGTLAAEEMLRHYNERFFWTVITEDSVSRVVTSYGFVLREAILVLLSWLILQLWLWLDRGGDHAPPTRLERLWRRVVNDG